MSVYDVLFDFQNIQHEPIELVGTRIILRTPKPQDDEQMCRLFSDPITMKYLWFLSKLPIGWNVEDMAVRRRGQVAGQNKTACVLYVIEKATGKLIGSSGFPIIDRINRNGKWGIAIDKDYWRGGYGTEALLLSLQYAFETLKLHRIVGETCEPNVRMRGLFEHFGLTMEAVRKDAMLLEDGFVDGYDYSILEDQWSSTKQKILDYLAQKARS